MRAQGQKTREGAASAVRNRHDHRHRGQLRETQELFDIDKRPGEKCGLGSEVFSAFGFALPDRLDQTTYSVGADFAYEIDVWGRNRNAALAAGAERQASEADFRAVRMGVLAQTVGTHVEIVDLKHQRRLASEIVEILGDWEALAADRYDRDGDLDIAGTGADDDLPSCQLASPDGRGCRVGRDPDQFPRGTTPGACLSAAGLLTLGNAASVVAGSAGRGPRSQGRARKVVDLTALTATRVERLIVPCDDKIDELDDS